MQQYKSISTAIRENASVQDLDIIKFKSEDYYKTFHEAVTRGDLSVLEWVHLNSPKVYPWEIETESIQIAITTGNLEITKFLINHGYFTNFSTCVDSAAINGHLHIIEYLDLVVPLSFTEKVLTTSHIDVLYFFRDFVNKKINKLINK